MKQVLLAVLLAGVALSCNPVKQSAKKDARAVDRVLGSRRLIDQVKPVVLDLYPCANDTFAVQLPGGFDTLYYPVPTIDTAAINSAIDSALAEVNTECRESVDRAYRKGYERAIKDVAAQQIAVKRPDTVINTIKDRQLINHLTGELNACRNAVAHQEGQLIEKDEQIKKAEKSGTSWLWWFIAALAALVATNGAWIYTKFKFK